MVSSIQRSLKWLDQHCQRSVAVHLSGQGWIQAVTCLLLQLMVNSNGAIYFRYVLYNFNSKLKMAETFIFYSDLSIWLSNSRPHVLTRAHKRARSISSQKPYQSSHSQYEANLNELHTAIHETKNDLHRRKIKIIRRSNLSAIIFSGRGDLEKY